MNQEELNDIVRLHGLWLRNEEGGVRADLSRADLCGAVLSGAVLSGANLRGADLRRADLSGAIGAPPYYSISWGGHGERGRRLHAVMVNNELWFSCGCFEGGEETLRLYIEGEGEEEYKQSRLKALELILELARAEGVK